MCVFLRSVRATNSCACLLPREPAARKIDWKLHIGQYVLGRKTMWDYLLCRTDIGSSYESGHEKATMRFQ